MWRTVKLGDICTIVNGGTPKSNVKDYWDGNIKWLTPKDMGKLQDRYVRNTERQITADGLANSSAKLVPKNSIILSCRAPIGHVFINDCDMSFNQGCKGLIPSNDLLVEYLYYFLFASKKLLNDLGTGTTFKEISGKTLSNVTISLPPLAEQQRIVARLDAAFAEIDRAARYTELRIDEILALQSLANDNLVKNYLRSFPSKPLGTLGDFKNGLNYSKLEKGYAVKILGVGDFQNNFHVESSFLAEIELSSVVPEDYLIKDDDILFVRSNGNRELIGRSVLVRNIQEPTTFSGFTIRFRLDYIQLSSEYICHILKSNIVRNKLADGGGGSSISNLNQKMLAEIDVPLAGKLEQQHFVEKMNSYITLFEESLASSMKKIELLKALKSAILAQELQPSEAA